MFYIKRFPTIETTSKTLRLEKPTVSFAALFLVVHRLNFVFPKSGVAYNYRCIDCSSQEASKIHLKKKEKRDIVLCHGNQRDAPVNILDPYLWTFCVYTAEIWDLSPVEKGLQKSDVLQIQKASGRSRKLAL